MGKRKTAVEETGKRKLSRYDVEENIKFATWMVENPFREKKGVLTGGETKRDWVKRMFAENGVVGRTMDSMTSKETFLRNKYKNAKKWAECTGQGVLETSGKESFCDALLKLCPWFWILHEDMDQLQQYNPTYLNNGGQVQEHASVLDDFVNQNNDDCGTQEPSFDDFRQDDDANVEDDLEHEVSRNEAITLAEPIMNSTPSNPSTITTTTMPSAPTSGQLAAKSTFSNSLRTVQNKRSNNSMHEAIVTVYKSRKEEKLQELSENTAVEIAKINLDREKWEWEKSRAEKPDVVEMAKINLAKEKWEWERVNAVRPDAVEMAKIELDREKWQWEKEQALQVEKRKQDHEEKMMKMRLQELELQLKLKQLE